jgi:hypothetical protein
VSIEEQIVWLVQANGIELSRFQRYSCVMDVNEFSKRNGIGPRRVRAMITSGDVKAKKVGRKWNILDETRPTIHTRRPLSDASREALIQALNDRTLEGLTGQMRARTAERINMLRASDKPSGLLTDWWRGATPTGISGAANLILHAQKGDDDRVREVLRRKQERYLRRPQDLARAVRDERTIRHLSVEELATLAELNSEIIERTGKNESIRATRRVLNALQITPSAIPSPAPR